MPWAGLELARWAVRALRAYAEIDRPLLILQGVVRADTHGSDGVHLAAFDQRNQVGVVTGDLQGCGSVVVGRLEGAVSFGVVAAGSRLGVEVLLRRQRRESCL